MTSTTPTDDFDNDEHETTEDGRPIVRHVVKDLQTALKMRRAQADADAARMRSDAAAERHRSKAEQRRRKDELRAEIARLRLRMTAREAASKHLAVFGPFYLMLLVAMFLAALGTGLIDTEQVPVVSALLTLLVTMIGSNVRSIISEGNGHEDDDHDHSHDEED